MRFLIFLCVVLAGAEASISVAAADVGPPADAWTAVEGNPGRTGSIEGASLAPPLVQRWTALTGGSVDPRLAGQPVIAEDRVFLPSPHSRETDEYPDEGSVYAFDRLTGRKLWERDLPAGRLAYADGTLVLATLLDGVAFGLDPATGRTRWAVPFHGSYTSPIAYGGRAFIGGEIFDLRDGAYLGAPFPGEVAIAGGVAYVGASWECGVVRAYDADTWEPRWSAPPPASCPRNGPLTAMSDGEVVSYDGIVRDAVTGAALRTTAFNTALHGGTLVTLNPMAGDEARTGVHRWTRDPGWLTGQPIVAGDTVYYGDGAGLRAIDLQTGADRADPITGISIYSDARLAAGQGTLIVKEVSGDAVAFGRPGPDTGVIEAPRGHVRTRAARFTFASTAQDARFECSLDDTAYATCSSPLELTNLGAGDHRLKVRSVAGGERDPAPSVVEWTVDVTAPAPSLGAGSTGRVRDRATTFTIADGEAWALARCSLDGATAEPCRDTLALTGLADGQHTLVLTSRDLAGNTATASRTWTVDATPPETVVASGPRGRTYATTAAFELLASEPGATFLCRLDDRPEADCGPQVRYEGLADGAHRLEVAASDDLGNRDQTPAVWTWSVDTSQPGAEPTPDPTPDPTPTATAVATPARPAAPSRPADPPPGGGEQPPEQLAPVLRAARRVSQSRLRQGRVVVRVSKVPSWITVRARLKAGRRVLAASRRAHGAGAETLRLRLRPRPATVRRTRKVRLVVSLTAAGETATLRRTLTLVRRGR